MRQANSSIKGYLYQFNKSIYEILNSTDDAEITVEGVIEDIDISTDSELATIQCKYHANEKYQISDVSKPILEMLCHFDKGKIIGKITRYILYAYYKENVEKVEIDEFRRYIKNTNDKTIMTSYFHRIYTIPEKEILELANKQKKSKSDKARLYDYYIKNRKSLCLCVDIEEFWKFFEYQPAKEYEELVNDIYNVLLNISDKETAEKLYYPNAFELISSLSSKKNIDERKITKKRLLNYLKETKTVLLNKWVILALDKTKLLKNKRKYLQTNFSNNQPVRAFIFSGNFLEHNESQLFTFIVEYTEKFFKKPLLQKPAIFIIDKNDETLINKLLLLLYDYQKSVNTGNIGNVFVEDNFVNNTNCPKNIICKITLKNNISKKLLENCNVNQLYIIGDVEDNYNSLTYATETLNIENIQTLKYLVGLNKELEDSK